jgi:WD40 repeat protein
MSHLVASLDLKKCSQGKASQFFGINDSYGLERFKDISIGEGRNIAGVTVSHFIVPRFLYLHLNIFLRLILRLYLFSIFLFSSLLQISPSAASGERYLAATSFDNIIQIYNDNFIKFDTSSILLQNKQKQNSLLNNTTTLKRREEQEKEDDGVTIKEGTLQRTGLERRGVMEQSFAPVCELVGHAKAHYDAACSFYVGRGFLPSDTTAFGVHSTTSKILLEKELVRKAKQFLLEKRHDDVPEEITLLEEDEAKLNNIFGPVDRWVPFLPVTKQGSYSAPPFTPLSTMMLIAMTTDSHVNIYDVGNKSLLQTIDGHCGRIYSARFHPVDPLLATCSADHTVRLWAPKVETHF